ncbi:hypothetical protein VXP97_13880, partial [Acinetobacter sp. 207]
MIQQITAYRFEQLNRQTEQLSNLLIFKFLNLKNSTKQRIYSYIFTIPTVYLLQVYRNVLKQMRSTISTMQHNKTNKNTR